MGEFAVVRRREASGHGGMYVLPPTTHSHCDGLVPKMELRTQNQNQNQNYIGDSLLP